MATYTVGTGGDYTDLTAAWNALCKGKTLTGDIKFEIISSHGLSGTISGTVTLNGHTLEICNADAGKHYGIVADGYIIETNGCGYRNDIADTIAGGTFNMHDVSFKSSGVNATSFNVTANGVGIASRRNIILESAIFNNVYIDYFSCSHGCTNKAANLKIVNCAIAGNGASVWLAGLKYSGDQANYGTAENITIYGHSSATNWNACLVDGAWQSVKNIVVGSIGFGEVCFSVPNPSVTFYNCAGVDNSLAGLTSVDCLNSIVAADEFISLDSASDDFLKPKTSGSIADGGTIPAYTTTDIAEIPIPDYSGWYPIGCHCADTIPPIPPVEFPDMIIDSGAVYKNYGTETEQLIGATRGGNKFFIDQKTADAGYDGRGNNVKGAKKIIYVQPYIEANIIEVSADLISASLPASEVSVSANHDVITRALQIALSDYCENITIVGELYGKNQPIICIVKNALCVSNFEIQNNDKSESVITLRFSGHFDKDDLKTDPWEIRYPTE